MYYLPPASSRSISRSVAPVAARGFTAAPGYTGPMPTGRPSDYSTFIPSSGMPSNRRLSGLPPVSIGQPGGGYGREFNTGGAISGAASNLQPGACDGPAWLCALIGGITGGLGGGNAGSGSGTSGTGGSSGALSSEGTGSCPSGFERNQDGQCVKAGFTGSVERFLPGGNTGTLSDAYGEAVVGAFGIPALVPRQTGTVITKSGEVRPTLGCPPGAILGKDSLCYMKGSIPRQFRKWKPTPKPVMSAADGKTLRKADRLRTKVKKLATRSGFTCRKR